MRESTGWGEPTKNGKEIFGFASPLPNSVYHNMQSLGIAIQHIC